MVLVIALVYVTMTTQSTTSGRLKVGDTNITAGLVDKEAKNDG